jgi:hypothetical protein
MLTILGRPTRVCSGVNRRELLQAGGAGLFGLSLPRLLQAEAVQKAAARPHATARAKSVIFLFLFGGPSQLETFDMKPEAPTRIRGPFQTIASRTPELRICEHLPQLATRSDRFCVVRSLTHHYNDHSTGAHYIQTGHPWHIPIGAGFNATEKDWPAMGSVVDYLVEKEIVARHAGLPNFVYLPNRLGHLQNFSSKLDRPGQYAGWLGRGYDPLATLIGKRDSKDNPYYRDCTDQELDFQINGLELDATLTSDRFRRRQTLLQQFDAARRNADELQSQSSYNEYQQRAFSLISSGKTREALDLKQEPAALRDRYGRNLFGQSTLVARRLVEAGVRFVTVAWDAPDGTGWDSHFDNDAVRNHLLPGLDRSLSTLLDDLQERGLLDETLVVCLGEMGRTPLAANDKFGRGHWSTLFPAVLAGAGIRGGMLYGRSDKDAGQPLEFPTKPEDLAATIFSALGIDPELRIHDPLGRPVALVDNGQPLHAIF